jgi:tRNA pseudouridine38-40 synthase
MTFCYDGTCYHGWQKQHNGRSIQATMERALGRMEAPNPSITAAGRTDTGVHALAQKAHFDYPDRMSTEQMIKAFNSLLPMDIKALEIMPVPDAFHARFDACERGYRYLLAKAPNPFTRLYMGFIPHKPVFFERLGKYIPVLLVRMTSLPSDAPTPTSPSASACSKTCRSATWEITWPLICWPIVFCTTWYAASSAA